MPYGIPDSYAIVDHDGRLVGGFKNSPDLCLPQLKPGRRLIREYWNIGEGRLEEEDITLNFVQLPKRRVIKVRKIPID